MDVQFSLSPSADFAADLLVVGVQGSVAEAATRALGAAGTAIASWIEGRKFEAKGGTAVTVPGLVGAKATSVAFAGLGDGGSADLLAAGGKMGMVCRTEKATRVAVDAGGLSPARLRDLVEGIAIGNYFYEPYLPEAQRRPAVQSLTVLGLTDGGENREAVNAGLVRAKWQRKVRDLVNAPAAEIYPESLAAEAQKLAALPGVTVEVWDAARCQAEGLVGIVAVGQGSARPPVLIHITYRAPQATEHVALVGKGVTFDSGGLSLKPSDGMSTMRCDMGGAGTVLGAVGCAAELGLAIHIDAFLPAAENMNSGNSYKLGDVLTYKNGVTVEVLNTDAEGRLILADALLLASEVPGVSRIVDLATLTGAMVVALGPDYTGLFTKDDGLANEILGAAAESNEKLWRMPLDDAYNRMIKATWGQIKNTGGREGGSITAALFLQYFVRKTVRWAHLDIAGPAFYDSAVEPYAKGGSGQPMRSLVSWLDALAS